MESKSIELILSVVLAIATVAYTIINLMMWYESRAARRQKLSPLVIAYLDSTASKQVLCLYIKNVGEGCARNVQVKILKDHNCLGKKDFPLSRFPIFTEGVNIFPSGYHLHYYVDYWDVIRNKAEDDFIELEISCDDIKGQHMPVCNYVLKFSQIRSNYSTPPDTYDAQIPFYLEHIAKTLQKNVDGRHNT